MPDQQIQPVEFKDPRRSRLHEQLESLGRGPAALFRDACRLFDGQIEAETAAHIAGHLQRELLSSVEDVLLPFGYQEPKAGEDPKVLKAILRSVGLPAETNTTRLRKTLPKYVRLQGGNAPSKIRIIADSLGLPYDHEIVDLARGLKLHTIAHRSGLKGAPPLDDVRETWERFQWLLSLLLDHFEASYASAYAKIRSAIDARDLETFRKKVPQNGATFAYFFEHVSGDDWFDILRASDLLTTPPAGGGWPALAYLRKMAVEHPAAVEEILLSIRPNENEFVLMGLIDAAKALAADGAVNLLHNVSTKALRLRQDSFVVHSLARAASEYAPTHPSAVRSIILPFLELRVNAGEPRGGILGSRELVARIDVYSYAELIAGPLQMVIAAEPRLTLDALVQIFESALQAEYGADGDEYSSAWRSAIEPHEQNYDFEPLAHFDAVRLSAEKVCEVEPGKSSDLVRTFLRSRWTIFRRLALHLARIAWPATADVARDLACDPVTIQADDTRHESHLFLARVFPDLDPGEKERILETILAGPRDTEDPRRAQLWKVRRLGWIREHLTGEARATYNALLERSPEPDESGDFDFYTTAMWVGPTSPMTTDQLRESSIGEILTFLVTWEPSGRMMEPTREGLARDLQAVSAERAVDFARSAERFDGLDATYVRALFAGLTEAVKAGTVITWEPVLKLAALAIAKPRAIEREARQSFDDDPDWGWTRTQIARLLQQGYRSGPTLIPLEMRSAVWNVLQPLTEDPDPDTTREDTSDPLATAINSTRGVAFEALFGYAAWVRGGFFQEPEIPGPAFHDMPEVEEVLLAHLDPKIDPSPAVRAVYGQHLYMLRKLAPGWELTHMEALAPFDRPGLADAFWQTYLVYGRHFTRGLFRDLRPLLERNVRDLAAREPLYRDYPRSLAHLVLRLYLWGDANLAIDSVLGQFFANADEETRAYAVGLLPQILHEDTTPEELRTAIDLAINFWNWRNANAASGEEFRGFGFWMPSENLDAKWRLKALAAAVERGGVPHNEHAVVETLAKLAMTHPAEVLTALEVLVRHGGSYMDVYRLTYRGEIQAVLQQALSSSDEAVRGSAKTVTNMLIAKGFTDLLSILPSVDD